MINEMASGKSSSHIETNQMIIIRSFVASILGLACTATGIWFRLAAHDLAWPIEWGYSGPREDTLWAIRENAYEDISLFILGFGLLVISVVLVKWLWSPARKPG